MPGLSRRSTYTDRKRARADALESEYGDYTHEDLKSRLGYETESLEYVDVDVQPHERSASNGGDR